MKLIGYFWCVLGFATFVGGLVLRFGNISDGFAAFPFLGFFMMYAGLGFLAAGGYCIWQGERDNVVASMTRTCDNCGEEYPSSDDNGGCCRRCKP